MFINLKKSIFLLTLVTLLLPTLAWAQPAAQSATVTAVAGERVETARSLINLIAETIVKYSLQVLGGIIVLIIGWIFTQYIARIVSKILTKHHIDITVSKFIVNGVKLLIMVFVAIVALGKFGIEVAPLIAGLSVAGFGLSFALQGPLSNYASGATLIFTKPFKVGDIIEVAGIEGEVTDIKLPRTEIRTLDGTTIVVPNKHIIGEIIHNNSDTKRLDLNVGVSYSSDVDKAIQIIKDTIRADKRIAREPLVGISQFADSSINLYARIWCKQNDYWQLMFDLNKAIWDAFKKNSIDIPFPQRDVHIYKES